jgi:hypothetical protein
MSSSRHAAPHSREPESLAELLNSLDVPETDDDDEDFDASLADAMQFGEYKEAEGEEEQEEADPFEDYCQPVLGEKSGVSPQWPSRMRALFHGSLEGGDLTSQTGILAGVAPMLLHASQSQHPERPARLVPARLVSNEDLALVHDRKHVRRATATYGSDLEGSEALELASDTYFTGQHSGYAARLSAGSVVELATRVAQGELRNALAVARPPGHHCEQQQARGVTHAQPPLDRPRQDRPRHVMTSIIPPGDGLLPAQQRGSVRRRAACALRPAPDLGARLGRAPAAPRPPCLSPPRISTAPPPELPTRCTTATARNTYSTTTRSCSSSRSTASVWASIRALATRPRWARATPRAAASTWASACRAWATRTIATPSRRS